MSGRIRLTILNETHYQRRDLRRFLVAAIRLWGVAGCRWTVRVTYARRHGWCTGYAYVSTGSFCIRLPKSDRPLSELRAGRAGDGVPMLEELAYVVQHELFHCMGQKSERGMPKRPKQSVPRFAWANACDVRPIEKKRAAVVKTIQERRGERAEAMLARHEKLLKREQKMVTKWRRKVQYYRRELDKRRAATTAQKEEKS